MFAKVLKELRTNAKMTQQELASKLKVATSTIGMYESGKRTPDMESLQSIAKLFGVSVSYLFGDENTSHAKLNKKKLTDDEKLQEFLDTARIHFMDAKEEDQDKIMKCLQDVFWETKEINRKKYNPNKNKPNKN